MDEIRQYERYDEVYDSILMKHLMGMYNKSYRKGWVICALVRLNDDKWIVKWERDYFATNEENHE